MDLAEEALGLGVELESQHWSDMRIHGLTKRYRCLEAVCGVHMRLVWPGGQLEGEVRDAGWEEAEGVWHAAVMPYGQLREVLGYMKKGAVMRPFGLMLEMGSERQPGT